MTRVSSREVCPGVRLRHAVTDSQGRVLLPAGAELTPFLLDQIRRWRIDWLDVQLAGASAGPPPEAGWERLFRRFEESIEIELIHAALQRWAYQRQMTRFDTNLHRNAREHHASTLSKP